MANSLVVMPYRDEDDLASWLAEQGIEPPDAVGSVPDRPLLKHILREADWPFRESGSSEVVWGVTFEDRDGRRPPIDELRLHDGFVAYRLGNHFGPWHVSREVARTCGPQVAVEGSGAATCVVLPDTTYEEFHLRIAGCPPREDRRDRTWSEPLSDAELHGLALPEEWPTTPDAQLEHVLARRRGHEQVASLLGRALADHREGRASLDEATYARVVARLREHVRATDVPTPGVVLALAGAEGAADDLAALAARLEGVEAAWRTRDLALMFSRRRGD